MRKAIPEQVSQTEITFKVEEIEAILSPPDMVIKPWSPMYCDLKQKDGAKKTMLIRSIERDEIPLVLPYIKRYMDIDRDLYDVVGARVYAELLAMLRNRIKDEYFLIGTVDGELAGIANGRLLSEKINISLHTMAFMRGMNAGAVLYYAKCVYCFEVLQQEEFWATYESYNGWKRWGIGMALPTYPYPDVQHELGGARVFYLTRKYWDAYIREYTKQLAGTELLPNPLPELLEKNKQLIIPTEILV
ncbi:MAG: N-acetyltransferase [Coprothermobacterota bacterium]|nr:N-acetyltransferase [Coprothermobacterota bacterium]